MMDNQAAGDGGNLATPPVTEPGQKFKLSAPLILGLVGGALVLGVLGYVVWQQAGRSTVDVGKAPESSSPNIILSAPDPNVRPPVLPSVSGDRVQVLRVYFQKVSPTHFKEKFMEQVPAAAYESYTRMVEAQDSEEKYQASLDFYIALTNPAVDKSDPEFSLFVADLRTDLAKQTGRPLI